MTKRNIYVPVRGFHFHSIDDAPNSITYLMVFVLPESKTDFPSLSAPCTSLLLNRYRRDMSYVCFFLSCVGNLAISYSYTYITKDIHSKRHLVCYVYSIIFLGWFFLRCKNSGTSDDRLYEIIYIFSPQSPSPNKVTSFVAAGLPEKIKRKKMLTEAISTKSIQMWRGRGRGDWTAPCILDQCHCYGTFIVVFYQVFCLNLSLVSVSVLLYYFVPGLYSW